MDVGSIVDFLLWISDTAFFKTMRMIGYVSFSLGLWYMALAGFHHGEHYYFVVVCRWMILGGAIHHTAVAIWAALVAVQIQIPNEEFTALLTITTTMMLIGFIMAAKNIIEDNRQ